MKNNVMTKHSFLLILIFSAMTNAFSQGDDDDGFIQRENIEKNENTSDSRYLEDQFYIGFVYNLLTPKPENVVQHNFSRGILFGFQKDIPINKQRNVGFSVGIGYAYNLIFSNIYAYRNNGITNYSVVKKLSDENLNENYFETQSLDFPLEFRWRTSTSDNHKFWRIYTGVRLGYVLKSKSSFQQNELNISFNNSDISKQWQFKIYTAFGYNTWNFFVQYNLSPKFKNAVTTTDGVSLKSYVLQMGLMFYIL